MTMSVSCPHHISSNIATSTNWIIDKQVGRTRSNHLEGSMVQARVSAIAAVNYKTKCIFVYCCAVGPLLL